MDPELASLFEQLAVFNLPSITTMEPADVRAAGSMVDVEDAEAAIPVAEWAELEVAGADGELAARRYRFAAAGSGTGAVPTIVWFHGGGWVLGDLDGAELLCRSLARDTGAVVLSVAYRLAPEHRFPAAVEDAVASLGWAADHADVLGGVGGPLVVGGDSAGGNLAAVVARLVRDAGGPALAAQVLVYPSTDLVGDYPSRHANADGPVLTAADGEWFARHYLGPEVDQLVSDPRASPLRADDLGDLAPAVVAVGEFDILHDEGLAYAEALRTAGNRVLVEDTPGLVHGYTGLITVSRAAAAALTAVARDLLELLS
jgi:acetyl esterase